MDNKELLDLLTDKVKEKYIALDIIKMKEDLEFWEAVYDITEETKRKLNHGKYIMRDDLYLCLDEFNQPIYHIVTHIGDTSLTVTDIISQVLNNFQDKIIKLPNVERYINIIDLHGRALEISREIFYGNLSIEI